MKIIATHVSSDFDSFAGMVAAKKLYPDAKIILPGSINQNVRKFISIYEDELPQSFEPADIDIFAVKKIIIIDTSIASRLGDLKSIAEKKGTEIIIYDHHCKSPYDILNADKIIKDTGATTSILVSILKKQDIIINSFEATLFALGIYEDTGSFSYPNTRPLDFEACSFLLKMGASLSVVAKFLNPPMDQIQHKLLEKLISASKKININEKKIILSSTETEKFTEGLSIITRKLGQIEDVDIVFCWVKMKDKTYLVARSDDPSVDVSGIIKVLGGGGHAQAASAVLKDAGIKDIENRLIASLYKNIKKPMVARDIMSYPIRTVSEDASIEKVNDFLKKYGHTGIPIVDSSNGIVGIITRKDVDRALKHGLSHAPVKGFKSRGLVTTGPNTTVEEIQRMMIENGIGRIPVVVRGEAVGIVTRKDILRYLHGKIKTGAGKSAAGTNQEKFYPSPEVVKERLMFYLPESIFSVLKKASFTAKKLKVKVYLVGGLVRDLLLGMPNLDVDIVVEGDGIALAEKLAHESGARVESYQKFKTAVIIFENYRHIDIASSRIEHYKEPAALPDIEPGSITQDLARRDFSINTLAISLNEDDFGRIIDFFGGRKDLGEKKIRVLHKLSFVEDPTRILRAVRFEQRLGFKMDMQTEKLAILSIKMNILKGLNGIRIRDELVSILNGKKPERAVRRLFLLEALDSIGINPESIGRLTTHIENAVKKYEKIAEFKEMNILMWRVLVSLMLLYSKNADTGNFCSRMKIKKKDCAIITEIINDYAYLKKTLGKKISKNSLLYSIISGKSGEMLLIVSAAGKTQCANISKFVSGLSVIKPEITGKDLKYLNIEPSKKYKFILDEILKLKLDKKIKTRQDELETAVKIIEKLK